MRKIGQGESQTKGGRFAHDRLGLRPKSHPDQTSGPLDRGLAKIVRILARQAAKEAVGVEETRTEDEQEAVRSLAGSSVAQTPRKP